MRRVGTCLKVSIGQKIRKQQHLELTYSNSKVNNHTHTHKNTQKKVVSTHHGPLAPCILTWHSAGSFFWCWTRGSTICRLCFHYGCSALLTSGDIACIPVTPHVLARCTLSGVGWWTDYKRREKRVQFTIQIRSAPYMTQVKNDTLPFPDC